MTKEIKELSNVLIVEIQKLIDNIEYFGDDDNKFEEYQDDVKDSVEKRLQKQETWYDQMDEKYLNIRKLYENGKKMKKKVKQYFKMIDEMTKTCKQMKEKSFSISFSPKRKQTFLNSSIFSASFR